MSWPDIPRCECSYTPETAQSITVTQGGVPCAFLLPLGSDGYQSHSALLSAWATMLSAFFGGAWTAEIDYASQRVVLTFPGAAIDVAWTIDVRDYLGYAGNVAGQASPYTAAAEPDGIWYPTEPVEAADLTVEGRQQVAWHEAAAVRTVGPLAARRLWRLRFLVDNTAADDVQVRQCGRFLLDDVADFRAFTLYPTTTSAWNAGRILTMDPGQREIAPFVRLGDGQRYYLVDINCIEREAW